jgi:ABC-type molybdate transport system substrate-binding protein
MKNTSLLAGLLLLCMAVGGQAAERIVTVFAAASLTDVLEQVGKTYTAVRSSRGRSNPAHRPRSSSRPTRTG